jgi:predicted regulator of Ras-like GTPase activity (Roadblock/LC7/MglB family)
MTLSERTGRKLILYALLAVIVPMLLFPRQFGLQLAQSSLVNLFYEIVYYGVVAFMISRRASLLKITQAAALTLVGRLGLGVLFAFLIAAMYGLNLSVAIKFGLSSYLPCVLFQVAMAPFVFRPITDQILGVDQPRRRAHPTPDEQLSHVASTPVDAVSSIAPDTVKDEPATVSRAWESQPSQAPAPSGSPRPPAGETSGFERAVKYVGEHSAVYLAVVVDREGLLTGSFCRGDIVAEDWAPLSLVFLESNQRLLDRNELGQVDRIDLRLENKRAVMACCGEYMIMVVADRQSDDVLNIRIAQAVEIVSRYVNDRYTSLQTDKVERTYVSGTE